MLNSMYITYMNVYNRSSGKSLIVGARTVIQYIIINIFLAPWPSALTGTVRYHFVEVIDWGLIRGWRQ